MRDLFLTVFVFCMLPVAVFSPHIGVYVWYWLGYMNPHRLTWGFAWGMPFAQLTAVATLLGLLLTKEERRIPWSRTMVLWMAFVSWASVTTLFAITEAAAQKQWQQFIKIQLMTLVAIMLINSRKRLITLVWVVAMSIGFYGIKGGIFTVLSGGDFRVWGPAKTMIEGNNELAFALIVILPLMRYLQLISKRRWVRRGLTGAMVLCAFSILGSQSRGALLAGGAMTLTLILKSRRRLVLGLGAIVMVGVLFQFAPDKWFNRMQTIQSYEEDASAMGRINAWHFAFNLAKDHPILGGGFDVFSQEMFLEYAPDPYDFHDSHSIYFGVMAEHGFVGLALFLGMGFSTMLAARRILKTTKGKTEELWAYDLASMIQVSIVGYAVGGAFLGLGYFDLLYNLVAFVIILQALTAPNKALAANEARAGITVRRRAPNPRSATPAGQAH